MNNKRSRQSAIIFTLFMDCSQPTSRHFGHYNSLLISAQTQARQGEESFLLDPPAEHHMFNKAQLELTSFTVPCLSSSFPPL